MTGVALIGLWIVTVVAIGMTWVTVLCSDVWIGGEWTLFDTSIDYEVVLVVSLMAESASRESLIRTSGTVEHTSETLISQYPISGEGTAAESCLNQALTRTPIPISLITIIALLSRLSLIIPTHYTTNIYLRQITTTALPSQLHNAILTATIIIHLIPILTFLLLCHLNPITTYHSTTITTNQSTTTTFPSLLHLTRRVTTIIIQRVPIIALFRYLIP